MRTTRIRHSVAALLAGALLAAAAPALAHAQSARDSGPADSRRVLEADHFKNLKSGKYLTASGTANGSRVIQDSYISTGLQTWESVLDGDYYSLENYSAGRNLGIDGASTAAGAAAIIANGSGDANQDWLRVYSYDDTDYFALKNRKSGLCLGVSGASTADGAAIAQFRCDGTANQGWAYA